MATPKKTPRVITVKNLSRPQFPRPNGENKATPSDSSSNKKQKS